ncbi:MAG: hypothetical protein R2813_00045, partial [Flavobacteriales bacterium]
IDKLNKKISKDLLLVSEKIDNKTNEVKLYSDTVKGLTEELTQIKIKDQSEGPPPQRMTSSIVSQTAAELNEIEKRKHNIVVFGLEESQDDRKNFVDFANRFHILSTLLEEDDIDEIDRLGKPNLNPSKPRLLRLKFRSQAKRKMTLTMHKHRLPIESEGEMITTHQTPTHQTNKVFVRPDLTKLQQESDQRLRDEQLRLGKDNYIINKGKVIPRDNHDAAYRLRRDNPINADSSRSLPPTATTGNHCTNNMRSVRTENNRLDDEITFKNTRTVTFTNSTIKASLPGPTFKCQTKPPSHSNEGANLITTHRTVRRLADPLAPTQFSL